MQVPTTPWNQPPDPRESTVSMPRIDPSRLTDQESGPETPAPADVAGVDLPGFGDPYAVPVRAPEPPPTYDLPAPAAHEPPAPAAHEPPAPAAAQPPETETSVPLPGTAAPVPTTVPWVASRTAPGSIAELRARLARLPSGHPSSPFDDAGRLRPTPPRLRHLELGLPTPSIGAPGHAERFAVEPAGTGPTSAATDRAEPDSPGPVDTDLADIGPAAPEPAAPEPAAAQPAAPEPAGTAGTLPTVRPATGATSVAPAEPTPAAGRRSSPNGYGPAAETASPISGGRPPASRENGHRNRDARPEWQHPYADPADHDRRDNGSRSGDGALARWLGDSAPGRERQRNGQQRAAPRLAPEHRALVDQIIAASRAAEGRNAAGDYGTRGLTPAMRRIAAQLPAGGLAPGSEAHTLKSADRFAEKLARLIARQPGRPATELAACISDAIRYAFTFETADYSEGTWLVHRKLKTQGFDLEARRNRWDSPEYKGIFTRWRDPAHGLSFEVQFHTVDSWATISQTHDAYLRITDPVTSVAERARLRARQATVAARVQPPLGCMDISDVRGAAR